MRTPLNNPFEAGADRVPRVWAGRTDEQADFSQRVWARRQAGLAETGRVLLGEPGIGKSVLVRRFAAQVVAAGGLDTGQVRIPTGSDPVVLLAGALRQLLANLKVGEAAATRVVDLLERLEQVQVMGTGVALGERRAPPAHVTLTETLVELGRFARDQGSVALVHLDEVQNASDSDQLSQLLVALGDALAHDDTVEVPGATVTAALPLVVYLTALPEFHDLASTRVGATFSRRFGTTMLEPLTDRSLTAALRGMVADGIAVADGHGGEEVVRLSQDAAGRIVELVHGDPYLFQLAGQHAWDAGEGLLVTAAEVDAGWQRAAAGARRHVERLLERLPALERRFVTAMADLQPQERTLTRITETLEGYDAATQLGPTAQRLDTVRGVIARNGSRRPYEFRARAVEALLTSGWPEEP